MVVGAVFAGDLLSSVGFVPGVESDKGGILTAATVTLLWLVALASIPLLEPWRALPLLAGALAGYTFFTVVLWGSIYYHLRTGAPWTNGLRFWRLVLTNSDPTSGKDRKSVV